jgi:hypothetical protein
LRTNEFCSNLIRHATFETKYKQKKQYGFVKTDFIDFILKIDVEIHEIRSAISVKYFGPKEGVPLKRLGQFA